MKALVVIVSTFLESRTSRRNLLTLTKLLAILLLLVVVFSVLFHVLMEREGQHHSWLTGLYWTLTVMSTLGFGDITFHTDLGRFFSIVVLVTGVIFLLVLLPFTFIEFFYAPWMKAQASAQAPRELPPETEGHVILTVAGAINPILVSMLQKASHPYFVLVPTLTEALEMHDRDVPVVVGDLSDPATYRRLRVDRAAMVVTDRSDIINTNVTFSVREVSETIPIVASARSAAARDALELAGVSLVLSLEDLMGQALARRVIDSGSCAQVIGHLDDLVLAEAGAAGTPLAGRTLANSNLRRDTGLTVVGRWDHGRLAPVHPHQIIDESTVFVLFGSEAQIEAYNRTIQRPARPAQDKPSVVIIGGGRVGRATARALDERGIAWTMIEREAARVQWPERTFVGDAAQFDLLVKAGLHDAASVVITTHDDDTNLFLTIFLRRLRARTQIISRCTHAVNAGRLHRAGADLVLSYASMSANVIFNQLRGRGDLLLAEGVSLFTAPVPPALAGLPLADTDLTVRTGCSVVALEHNGRRETGLNLATVLPAGARLVLVGSLEAEEQFRAAYPET